LFGSDEEVQPTVGDRAAVEGLAVEVGWSAVDEAVDFGHAGAERLGDGSAESRPPGIGQE
jgi:hypothetical protein